MTSKGKFKNIPVCFLALMALDNAYLSPAFAHGGMSGNGHIMPWIMGNWGMGWVGLILTLLFWVLVIYGVVALIRWIMQTASGQSSLNANDGESSRAMEILKERYARGEISRDEFESMKKDLQ